MIDFGLDSVLFYALVATIGVTSGSNLGCKDKYIIPRRAPLSHKKSMSMVPTGKMKRNSLRQHH